MLKERWDVVDLRNSKARKQQGAVIWSQAANELLNPAPVHEREAVSSIMHCQLSEADVTGTDNNKLGFY